jgi:hypothetical protein
MQFMSAVKVYCNCIELTGATITHGVPAVICKINPCISVLELLIILTYLLLMSGQVLLTLY